MTTPHHLVCGYCDGVPEEAPGVRRCRCVPAANRRVRYLTGDLSAEFFRASLSGRDLWRYQALLPAPRKFGSPLSVGGTPLLDLGLLPGDVHLHVKDETRNPSGSLKDRATEVALAVARNQGHDRVIAASTGNAGASLACIAAAQGMRATVVVPASAPRNKLTQIEAHGAELVTVDGSYDDAFDHAVEYAERTGTYCRNTGINPYVREGKKTAAFEIAEQLDWTAPTWVVVPCGDGNIISGIGTGFGQLTELGCLPAAPRLVAAQVASSNSITLTHELAVRQGEMPREPVVVRPRTVADSISVGRPRDHVGALRALRDSDGLAVAVDESEVRPAARALARRFGLWLEPSAAVGYAALTRLQAAGTIGPGDVVVLLATGSGLKNPRPWEN
ncbi:pyridoxal-phosphate dependent enzyme [Micromonospora sp. CPCC 205546]|uniref:threonine synthase n=1 Tax=Micromonospora sp. CPCC 205546 TaxID=3122397 RepID=UPI002FF17DC1